MDLISLVDPTSGSLIVRAGLRLYPLSLRYRAAREGTATRYLLYHAVRRSLGLYRPDVPAIWVSYLFPPELLASYGLVGLIPEQAATTALGYEPVRQRVEAAVNRLPLSRDVCSYHRAALASLRDGLLPAPALCLGTTPLCVGKELFLEQVAAEHGVDYRTVRVPIPPDEGPAATADVAEVQEQLREVHAEIGRVSGRTADLRRAAVYSNRAVTAWNRLSRARLDGEVFVGGRESFGLTFLGQLLWGTKAGARGFERLLTERGRADLLPEGLRAQDGGNGAAGAAERRARLLWLHTVPHYDPAPFRLITEQGAVVVFEEMAQADLPLLDPDDPFPGMARRLLEHPLWGTSARRARLVVQLARRGRVDGVVHFNHRGCRHGVGSVPVLRDALREAGIPFVAVDGDALDRSSQQACRQLETFLELLAPAGAQAGPGASADRFPID